MNQQEMTSDLLDRLLATPANERWSILRDSGKPIESLQLLLQEVNNRAMLDLKSARAAGEMVIQLADLIEDDLCSAQARRTLSRVLAYESEYEQSLEVALVASEIATQAGLQEEAARAQLASMHALTEMGRFDEAAEVGKDSRNIFTSLELPAMAARADINLGVVYQHMGRSEKSIDCLERAKESVIDEPNILGHLENNLGEALLEVDDIEQAEISFKEAREAFIDAEAGLTTAIAEGNLADLAARRGRLSESLSWFEKARNRLTPIEASGHLARLLAERAETLSMMGMYEAAKGAFEDAIPRLDEAGLLVEAARARRGFGRTLMFIGDFSAASTMLDSAATACEDLSLNSERAAIYLDRARLAVSFGNNKGAQRLAYQSLTQFQGKPLHEAEVRLVLASSLINQDPVRAESEIDAAEVLARRLDIPTLLVGVLHLRGKLRRLQGRLSLATSAFDEAIGHADRIRGSVQADRCRAAIGLQHRKIYEDQLAALVEMHDENRATQALIIADRMGLRVLLDQARRAFLLADSEHSEVPSSTDHPDQREYTLLKEKLSVMYSRLADGLDDSEFNVERWRNKLRKTEEQLESIELRLSACGKDNFETSRLDVDALQLRLTSDTTLIQYTIVGEKLIAFVVTSDTVELVRDLGTVEEVSNLLDMFKFQVDRAVGSAVLSHRRFPRMVAETQKVLGELHEILFANLPKSISNAKRLVIVPQGLLNLVPFHALYDGEHYLIEKQVVKYAPSASMYKLAVERQPNNQQSNCLVVGSSSSELPAVAEEVNQVSMEFGKNTSVLRDEEATVSNFRSYAPQASLIHMAGHGSFSKSNSGASGIRLNDQWLTLNEISSMHFGADLVILSSCESGPMKQTGGEEATGLFHGFLSAGVRGLLSSMWRVSDESTKKLFANFYCNKYAEHSEYSFSEALQQAQLEVMEEMPHPAHWAPFIFTGADQ